MSSNRSGKLSPDTETKKQFPGLPAQVMFSVSNSLLSSLITEAIIIDSSDVNGISPVKPLCRNVLKDQCVFIISLNVFPPVFSISDVSKYLNNPEAELHAVAEGGFFEVGEEIDLWQAAKD